MNIAIRLLSGRLAKIIFITHYFYRALFLSNFTVWLLSGRFGYPRVYSGKIGNPTLFFLFAAGSVERSEGGARHSGIYRLEEWRWKTTTV
ncbi:hypothetical protein [Dickeya dianthicola]|uniref:hypothetical protein n=1 Tax=Dickeya dianthicola TaxID=204039 RepID=UPI00128F0E9C|nr:hypothetical protein [Dickeya dianthicola]MCI4070205.1 hypothetical protein [Dickeya dianthicola]MCI4191347.1 hypothetical protein [Dickeya dianthicola]MCI4199398.1 hypothetical protein [Dickeya dianthicola]MCI4208768.1 hypothetical protein [Dickeya dianthicola]MCI4228298.1 hypothetical protein [Dickeya dianthicola]